MTKLSTKRVPPIIPKGDFNILVVGEAPGNEETAVGEAFIGKSGQLQQRYFERLHKYRGVDIGYMNLCNYQPDNNDFEHCLGTSQLQEGLDEIHDVIRTKKPNVTVAFGNWPLFFLSGNCGTKNNRPNPGSGIMLYRGSRLAMHDKFGGGKLYAAFHPSFVLRTWSWNPVFFHDIQSAVEDSGFPDLRHPTYEEYIDPPADVLHTLVQEAQQSEWISIDIETFRGGKFSCVGFAFRKRDNSGGNPKDVGVCITFQRPDLWRFAKEIWECPTPKIFQYGTYDISFMRHFYQWKVGGYYNGVGWDTYVASASIMPDFPRGLDFLASVYTRFAYYKEERKVWRQEGDMTTLWKYNIKDTVATLHIALKQMSEIKELFHG